MTKSIFLKRISATVQFILGFLLGIGLIAGISGAVLFAYYKKMSVLPQKPIYPKVNSNTQPQANSSDFTDIEPIESVTSGDKIEESLTTQTETESSDPQVLKDTPSDIGSEVEDEPEPEPPLENESELPADAYRAVVTWPEGLSLRSEPTANSGRVGGISADASIIILEESADGNWQRVRLPWSGQEGWVKAGNVRRTSY